MKVYIDTPENGYSRMTATTIADLHTFAKEIGLTDPTCYVGDPEEPHYIASTRFKKKAIIAGAEEVSRVEMNNIFIKHYSKSKDGNI